MNILSSLLNFIGQKIEDLQSPDEFALTLSADIANGSGQGFYDKVSGIVRINLHFNNNSDAVSSSTPIFTVPEQYRPTEYKYGSGVVWTGAATTLQMSGCPYRIETNGTITQKASNYATRGFGYIEYKLGG